MRGPAAKPIVIAAGGTGGHFFPAEALAAALISRGHRVVLMTDARSAALQSAVFAGGEIFRLRGAGLAGRGVWRATRAAVALIGSTWRARQILKSLDAAAIVGFGGYPSVPPVLAARTLKRRPFIVLQEQNAVLGRANMFLSRFADCLALGFAATRRVPAGVPTTVTGNPVRPAIAAIAHQAYEIPTGRIRLLVLGGSLGARVFSDIVPAVIAALPPVLRERIDITQQCRGEDIGRVTAAYHDANIAADLAPFFTDVADKLARAHLVIARAGASTCAELAVAGRPAILVPLPGAIDDHQTANAAALRNAGAARVVPQAEFTVPALAALLIELLTESKSLAAAAQAAAAAASYDAAARLADIVEQYGSKKLGGTKPFPPNPPAPLRCGSHVFRNSGVGADASERVTGAVVNRRLRRSGLTQASLFSGAPA
jgi:UDP-N-acetylglucosamine--N-acetylmuramyl-(pentapeptide) pyrophosphoryl-undecaprenol N-acetylglucosamine transferase